MDDMRETTADNGGEGRDVWAGAGEGPIPKLPRPRMPRSQRAKIFIPFDPLKGYQDALREKEREAERLHRNR